MRLLWLLTFSAAAASPSPAAPAPVVSAEASRAAVASLDVDRLYEDKTYAAEMLAHFDAFRPLADNAEARTRIDLLRIAALGTLERRDEAVAAIRAVVAANSRDPYAYGVTVLEASRAGEDLLAVELLEKAALNLTGPQGFGALREMLSDNVVDWVRGRMSQKKAKPAQRRLARALLTIGWPSPDRASVLDFYRSTILAEEIVASPAAARRLAAEITDPAQLLPLIVSRRYDALFADDKARLARLEAAIAAFDQASAKQLRAHPRDLDLVLERAQFLRGVGREQDALALMLPLTADFAAVEAGGQKAFWIVNEAAYALVAVGRSDDAVALMQKLIGLDIDRHPYLISMAINHGEILGMAGRYREAAAYGERLAATAAGRASDYGDMWMWETVACGYALAGQPELAAPWMARLKAGSANNEAAHMRALICTGDMTGAEALMLARLAGEDSDQMLVALQDYRLDPKAGNLMEDRFRTLRSRPSVAAAIAAKGRILSLPMSKTYWGEY